MKISHQLCVKSVTRAFLINIAVMGIYALLISREYAKLPILARGSGPSTYYRQRSERDIKWCHENRLWANSTRPRVALASFPGSGNTWMRYLLQQSTGILTGSVFADPSLKKSGFGEGINNRSGWQFNRKK